VWNEILVALEEARGPTIVRRFATAGLLGVHAYLPEDIDKRPYVAIDHTWQLRSEAGPAASKQAAQLLILNDLIARGRDELAHATQVGNKWLARARALGTERDPAGLPLADLLAEYGIDPTESKRERVVANTRRVV
jgi:hypothetical protein